jgi:hypothetical protein
MQSAEWDNRTTFESVYIETAIFSFFHDQRTSAAVVATGGSTRF